MISVAVTPMSAFCVSRYSYFNKYVASNQLNDALESVALIVDDEDMDKDEKESSDLEQEALYVLDSCLTKTKPFDMKDMEDVLELMVPSVILWNLNIYLLYAGMTYLYIFVVIFIVAMFLVIWYKFSANIGMITPLLLPLSCLVLEFFSFVFMGTLSMLFHQQSAIAAIIIAPLIGLMVGTLFWKKNGVAHEE